MKRQTKNAGIAKIIKNISPKYGILLIRPYITPERRISPTIIRSAMGAKNEASPFLKANYDSFIS